MEKYRLNFYIVGISDEQADQLDNHIVDVDVKRKGDLWNKRTGRRYEENIVKKTMYTTYEQGFQPIIEKLIVFIKNDLRISMLLKNARKISLQICVDLDDECRVPYIHFFSNQLAFFAEINSEIDFHIS